MILKPFTKTENTGGGTILVFCVCFLREEFNFEYMILRYLWDIQMKMFIRQKHTFV